MNRNYRFMVGALVLVAAVGYLMFTGVQQTSVYYFTIDEFIARKGELDREGVRVAGRVQPGSVSRQMTPKGEELNFHLKHFTTDGEPPDAESVPVHFIGITPDMFKDEGGSDVIVEGTYRDGTLYAQSVLTQCPSKYEAETTTAAR